MVQDVLADDEWATALTDADRRGLTPLFWTHVAPYGEVKLDMTSRRALGGAGPRRSRAGARPLVDGVRWGIGMRDAPGVTAQLL
jgi:hypothetical protein